MQNIKYPILVFLFSLFVICLSIFIFGNIPIAGDDIWGATAVLGNPLEAIVFTLRQDIHPPLYYSFLDLWAIFNNSDTWLRMSSAFTHALLVLLVFNFVQNREGRLAAILASMLVFSSPMLLEYSTKLRMYSLISLISFSIFYLTHKYISSRESKYLKWIFILGIILTNVHAIGILFVFFHFCYGFLNLLDERKKLIQWMLIHIVLAVLSIPAIANSLIKAVGHAAKPSTEEITNLLLGLFISGHFILIILPVFLLLLVVIDKELRKLLICYLILPLALYAIISYTVKPLWLDRNFVFALPIMSVAMALAVVKTKIPTTIKILIPVIFLVANLASWKFPDHTGSEEAYLKETLAFMSGLKPIDDKKICIISVNQRSNFWQLQRYMNKKNWGNPTEIQPPITERWLKIAGKLPSFIVNLLKLYPHPNFTETEEYVISSDETDRCEKSDIGNIYVIGDKKNGYDGYKSETNIIFRNLEYTIYQRQ
jgi:hypothetical protein